MEEKPKHNPQKKIWEDVGFFETYQEAKIKSESMDSETKVRRCGPDGTKYKVKRVKKYLEGK
tara:strand:+ start:253 stop:438 length:186 start_codon:yes stop_codon:yes gene_type:complete